LRASSRGASDKNCQRLDGLWRAKTFLFHAGTTTSV
jgi:hypothetical protein